MIRKAGDDLSTLWFRGQRQLLLNMWGAAHVAGGYDVSANDSGAGAGGDAGADIFVSRAGNANDGHSGCAGHLSLPCLPAD